MSTGRLIVGLIFIAVGLSSFSGIDLLHWLVPAIFLYIGIRILIGHRIFSRRMHHWTSELHEDDINEVSIFSGTAKRVTSSAFTGGKAVAIFSGTELDLRHAKIKGKTAEIHLVAIYAGFKVIVPKEWRVVSEGTGVLGGFANHTAGTAESSPKLIVRGAAIFGGVAIVN